MIEPPRAPRRTRLRRRHGHVRSDPYAWLRDRDWRRVMREPEALDRRIRTYLEADTLAYLSLDGLRAAIAPQQNSYCTSCYTGVYPVAFPRDEHAYLQLALKVVD